MSTPTNSKSKLHNIDVIEYAVICGYVNGINATLGAVQYNAIHKILTAFTSADYLVTRCYHAENTDAHNFAIRENVADAMKLPSMILYALAVVPFNMPLSLAVHHRLFARMTVPVNARVVTRM